MTASIYLTSSEGRSGKSAVALGVLDALLPHAPRVGVFRPLIRSREQRDRVLELLLAHAGSDIAYDACVGASCHCTLRAAMTNEMSPTSMASRAQPRPDPPRIRP